MFNLQQVPIFTNKAIKCIPMGHIINSDNVCE